MSSNRFVRAGGLLGLTAAAIALALSESAPRLTATVWSDTSARVAKGDAPLYLQVRIEADGRLVLRSTTGGAPPTWNTQGTWRLDPADAHASMRALQGFHGAITALLPDEESAHEHWDARGDSRSRLLIDADPGADWRHALWAIESARAPRARIRLLTVLAPDAFEDVELDVPAGGSRGGEMRRGLDLEVRVWRPDPQAPGEAPFTRIQVESCVRLMHDDSPPWWEGGDDPSALVTNHPPLDLRPASVSAAIRADTTRTFGELVRSLASGQTLRVANVRAAGYGGSAFIPCADVVPLLSMLRAAGFEHIGLEGAAAPLSKREGGGWQILR